MNIVITGEGFRCSEIKGNMDGRQSRSHQLADPLRIQQTAVGIQLGLNAPGGAVGHNLHTILEL
ncbi:hypothetical protein D3C86_2268410 [compost metagenome]